jgi:formylglycine-generating enzyme required for sulfatase activity
MGTDLFLPLKSMVAMAQARRVCIPAFDIGGGRLEFIQAVLQVARAEEAPALFISYVGSAKQTGFRPLVAMVRALAEEARKPPVDAVTGPSPYYKDPSSEWGGGKRPAMMITWLNAMTYCRWLSKKTGKRYRLPTEAEWEYARRAGGPGPYALEGGPDKLPERAWSEETSDSKTQEVAKKKPNAWGLYDMEGNVAEWVLDFYGPNAYGANAKGAVSPEGPAKGEFHSVRGGAYLTPAQDLRAAARGAEEDWWIKEDPNRPSSRWWLPEMSFIGFRVACEAEAR